jgi:hypothetical protein
VKAEFGAIALGIELNSPRQQFVGDYVQFRRDIRAGMIGANVPGQAKALFSLRDETFRIGRLVMCTYRNCT